jgi:Sel1 repeat-containing protein
MERDVEAAAAPPSCRFRGGVVAYCSTKNSSRTKVTMSKISVCVAVLAGLLVFLPSQSWSQGVKQAKPAVGTTLLAADRYGDARELERTGQWDKAMQAYHELAASGHGPAQKKLGDIYGTGHGEVQRDYETSLRWYQRAREQGIEIPQPFSYPGVRR